MHALRRCCPLLFFTVLVLGFAGCGGGGSQSAAPTPVFTSTPVQTAVEGSPYSYQLAASDSAGSPITYALTSAPDGATLNGSTISWSPTAAQSRVANNFTVTARNSTGGSATQFWTVTPNGTVRVSWIDTYWTESGPVDEPYKAYGPVRVDLAKSAAIVVPNVDGSFQTLSATSSADGVLSFSNVPAGYYWLRLLPGTMYWTNSSNFDAGTDISGTPTSRIVNQPTVVPGTGPGFRLPGFEFDLHGLEPLAEGGRVQFFLPQNATLSALFDFPLPPNATAFSTKLYFSSKTPEVSQAHTGFLLQYKSVSLDSRRAKILGPSLTLPDLALSNEAMNSIEGTLVPSPQSSLDLSIRGTSWKPFFDAASPAAVTPLEPSFSVWVAPFVEHSIAEGTWVNLLSSVSSQQSSGSVGEFYLGSPFLQSPSCMGGNGYAFFPSGSDQPASSFADLDFGTVQYGDPFPSSWLRTYQVCQRATVQVPRPNAASTEVFTLTNGALTALPNVTSTPLISPTQNPQINGISLFTATTVNSSDIALSWAAPTLGSPYGYSVRVFAATTEQTPVGTISYYSNTATLYTAKTSLRIPPGIITPGNTYVFLITSLADAGANMESSPNRSALPVANADLISAPITIGSAGQ
jgi:hypothetical protein